MKKKRNQHPKRKQDLQQLKLIKYIVKGDTTLDNFLIQIFPEKSKTAIKQLLQGRYIQIDNQIITQFNYPLNKQQEVFISKTPITKKEDTFIDILHEDDEIIIINKPSGLLSMASETEKNKTAYHLVKLYLQKKNYKSKIFIVHRLDRDTSGILMFAKNENIKRLLQENWNDLVTKRGYVAIVEGRLKNSKDTIKSYLVETKTQLVYSTNNSQNGKLAITNYQTINQSNKFSLLDVSLDTGRKNQIRVHMQDLGHSIIGDKKYGAKTNPLNRLGLHAHKLEFTHPITKKKIVIKTMIPKEFIQLFNN